MRKVLSQMQGRGSTAAALLTHPDKLGSGREAGKENEGDTCSQSGACSLSSRRQWAQLLLFTFSECPELDRIQTSGKIKFEHFKINELCAEYV